MQPDTEDHPGRSRCEHGNSATAGCGDAVRAPLNRPIEKLMLERVRAHHACERQARYAGSYREKRNDIHRVKDNFSSPHAKECSTG